MDGEYEQRPEAARERGLLVASLFGPSIVPEDENLFQEQIVPPIRSSRLNATGFGYPVRASRAARNGPMTSDCPSPFVYPKSWQNHSHPRTPSTYASLSSLLNP